MYGVRYRRCSGISTINHDRYPQVCCTQLLLGKVMYAQDGQFNAMTHAIFPCLGHHEVVERKNGHKNLLTIRSGLVVTSKCCLCVCVFVLSTIASNERMGGVWKWWWSSSVQCFHFVTLNVPSVHGQPTEQFYIMSMYHMCVLHCCGCALNVNCALRQWCGLLFTRNFFRLLFRPSG